MSTEESAYGTYSGGRARAFELAAQIERFQAYPPKEREIVRANVRELLRKEAARGQVQHSALWRNARVVYGINPETL